MEILQYKNLIRNLIIYHLFARYKKTIFGYLWTLVTPLLIASITAIVFSVIFNTNLNEFVIFLFSGLIAWNLFNVILTQGASVFIHYENLLKKIYLPRIIFPIAMSLSIFIDAVLSSLAFIAICVYMGSQLSLDLLFMILSFVLLYLFSFGIMLTLACITVMYRDIPHIVTIMLQAFFFLTPILYDKTMLSGKLADFMVYNPLVYFIDLFRIPIMQNAIPDLSLVMICFVFSISSLLIGFYIYIKTKDKITLYL